MKRTQNIKGFTIIEVVLVLAIAGLIFLMVFIALPALQAGQRDTARRSDVSNVASAVTSFASSNRGRFPNTAQLETQLKKDTTTTPVSFGSLSNNIKAVTVASGTALAAGSKTVEDGTITIYVGYKCDPAADNTDTTTSIVAATAREFATVTKLEGGAGTGYCL